jgi:hypothetical protein
MASTVSTSTCKLFDGTCRVIDELEALLRSQELLPTEQSAAVEALLRRASILLACGKHVSPRCTLCHPLAFLGGGTMCVPSVSCALCCRYCRSCQECLVPPLSMSCRGASFPCSSCSGYVLPRFYLHVTIVLGLPRNRLWAGPKGPTWTWSCLCWLAKGQPLPHHGQFVVTSHVGGGTCTWHCWCRGRCEILTSREVYLYVAPTQDAYPALALPVLGDIRNTTIGE